MALLIVLPPSKPAKKAKRRPPAKEPSRATRNKGLIREGRYEVLPVLAGAYRGKDLSARALLSHVLLADAERTLCNRVPAANLADAYSEGAGGEPSCPECAARLARARR